VGRVRRARAPRGSHRWGHHGESGPFRHACARRAHCSRGDVRGGAWRPDGSRRRVVQRQGSRSRLVGGLHRRHHRRVRLRQRGREGRVGLPDDPRRREGQGHHLLHQARRLPALQAHLPPLRGARPRRPHGRRQGQGPPRPLQRHELAVHRPGPAGDHRPLAPEHRRAGRAAHGNLRHRAVLRRHGDDPSGPARRRTLLLRPRRRDPRGHHGGRAAARFRGGAPPAVLPVRRRRRWPRPRT